MSELWLPETVEGRYGFGEDDYGGKSSYPVVVKAQDGKWVAVCEDDAYFLIGQVPVRQREIAHGILIKMNWKGHYYFIYSEAETPEDRILYPYRLVSTQPIWIGRFEENDICCGNRLISRRHAVLKWQGSDLVVYDNQSMNGVYVNGTAIQECVLHPGDTVFIMGLRIIVGIGYLAINNGNHRATISATVLEQVRQSEQFQYAECRKANVQTEYINRLPRRREQLDPEPIELEAPPNTLSSRMPLLLKVGNPLLMGGQAIFRGNIFSAVTSMFMPLLTQGMTEKDRKEYEQKRLTKYREYLAKKEEDIRFEKSHEEKVLRNIYPDVESVLDFVSSGDRLWERQHRDADFLNVRIGFGSIPMHAELQYPARRFDLEQDELEEEMYALAERPVMLEASPVMLPLKESFICGIVGEREESIALVRNMIVQLALTHAYDEVKMVLLADDAALRELDFVPYLPHSWDNQRSVRYVAKSKFDAQQLSKELMAQYELYSDESSAGKIALKSGPAFVIFALNKEMYDAVEMLEYVTQQEEYKGFSVVTAFDTPSKDTMVLLKLGTINYCDELLHPERPAQSFRLDAFPEEYGYEQLHRVMNSKLRLEEQQSSLPNSLTFLEMYGVGKVEYLNPMKRWSDNDPVKSLAAPIGVGTDGKLFTLDLHEKKQGPHGLIAGSTGSGKSEFIITYILSMAVNYSPDEVAFVLIDYKGGGLADAFVDKKRGIHLPHVVGTITNLDGAGIQRSLLSINSELKRRQAVFSKAKSETEEGTMDIYDYQRLYRQNRVQEPMPHLFIISDEFAELKKQQPEFMDELISTARIGRSLGVHLILATQKPSGVVNDQIWSNTKFRVCLKVADKSDSMEMLKRPEAAELKQTGRFYLQVGYNDLFALGQSGWCGAPYEESEELETKEVHAARFVDTTGQVVLTKKQELEKKKSEKKQIVAIVQYLSDLAKRENIIPRQLWKDALPAKLEYDAAASEADAPAKGERKALLGMVDDPELQCQYPLWLDFMSFHHLLVVGPSSSGKSSFLRSMLWSAVSRYSPEEIQYYLVDLSGGALSVFQDMPHCGAYLTKNHEREFERLLAMIREIAAERKKLFADANVSSFETYLQVRPMPLILFVIDSYQSIASEFAKGSEISAGIHTTLAEIANCGIRVILTVNHSNECSTRAKQEIDCRFALAAKDRYEAGEILSTKVQTVPPVLPGRGICVLKDRALEFHTAVKNVQEPEQTALMLLKEELESKKREYGGRVYAKILPTLSSGQTYEDFCVGTEKGVFPLGYSVKEMKRLLLPFQQFTCLPTYLGNRDALRPILRNYLYAAQLNDMEVLVVKRTEDSAFDSLCSLLKDYSGSAELFYCTDEDVTRLAQKLNELVLARNELVNEYSDSMGIPREERGRAKKAAAYIRKRTKPYLILFESFGDFIRLKKSDFATSVFSAFLGGIKGYNIYFIGCLFPEDNALRSDAIMTRFSQTEIGLLFGGQYNAQCICSDLPMEYRRMDKANREYDRGVMRYRGEWYEIQMPCGVLEHPVDNPGEESIV